MALAASYLVSHTTSGIDIASTDANVGIGKLVLTCVGCGIPPPLIEVYPNNVTSTTGQKRWTVRGQGEDPLNGSGNPSN